MAKVTRQPFTEDRATQVLRNQLLEHAIKLCVYHPEELHAIGTWAFNVWGMPGVWSERERIGRERLDKIHNALKTVAHEMFRSIAKNPHTVIEDTVERSARYPIIAHHMCQRLTSEIQALHCKLVYPSRMRGAHLPEHTMWCNITINIARCFIDDISLQLCPDYYEER